jgi:hypothetical protein
VAAYRCIALRRTGGLAAMRLEVEVDLTREEPGAAELAQLLGAVDLAALAPPPAGGGGAVPDGYHYDLTLAGEDGPHELAFDAGGVPAELRPVVRALERRALDELRARRSGAG